MERKELVPKRLDNVSFQRLASRKREYLFSSYTDFPAKQRRKSDDYLRCKQGLEPSFIYQVQQRPLGQNTREFRNLSYPAAVEEEEKKALFISNTMPFIGLSIKESELVLDWGGYTGVNPRKKNELVLVSW